MQEAKRSYVEAVDAAANAEELYRAQIEEEVAVPVHYGDQTRMWDDILVHFGSLCRVVLLNYMDKTRILDAILTRFGSLCCVILSFTRGHSPASYSVVFYVDGPF